MRASPSRVAASRRPESCFVPAPRLRLALRPMPRWSLLSPGPRLCSTPRWSRRWLSSSRTLSQAAQDQQSAPRWGDTLLLPKTSFPLYNDPSKDPKIKAKTTDGLYQWQVGVCPLRNQGQPSLSLLHSPNMPMVRCLSSLTALHMQTVTSTSVSHGFCSDYHA